MCLFERAVLIHPDATQNRKAESALGYTYEFYLMLLLGPFIAFPGYGDLSLDETSRNFPLSPKPLV